MCIYIYMYTYYVYIYIHIIYICIYITGGYKLFQWDPSSSWQPETQRICLGPLAHKTTTLEAGCHAL